MDLTSVLAVCFIAFAVAGISVVVGGTSLMTVPLLISLGMTSKNAIATNMFALIFLSMSGAIGFRKEIDVKHSKSIAIFSILTICGSFIGASIVPAIDQNILRKVIAVVICVIAACFMLKRDLGVWERKDRILMWRFLGGTLLVFVFGIYGGFFSGGYVTLLSYVLIVIFGLNFLQVAYISKLLNIFSSIIACVVFHFHGLIIFPVAIPLAIAMSLGAFAGSRLAVSKGNLWVRNIFIVTAVILAVKLLIF